MQKFHSRVIIVYLVDAAWWVETPFRPLLKRERSAKASRRSPQISTSGSKLGAHNFDTAEDSARRSRGSKSFTQRRRYRRTRSVTLAQHRHNEYASDTEYRIHGGRNGRLTECEQRRERPALASATTRRTSCADAAVCSHREDWKRQEWDANTP